MGGPQTGSQETPELLQLSHESGGWGWACPGLCCFCLSCTHSPFQKQPRFPWGTPFPMLSYDVWVRLALC